MRKRGKGKLSLVMACCMAFTMLTQSVIPANAEPAETSAEYSRAAVALDLEKLPGVYTTKAVPGDGMETEATMGIPSVAKQTLENKPTTESPAIIMGAAVNYEKKTGPVEYTPFVEGTERVAPYSYFRHGIVEEQRQEEDGTISTHKKLSGFDGSYYIIRVDVSDIIAGKGEDQFLHVSQESNKALMVAFGFEGTTFSDALGNKTGSYSLAENARALKDNGDASQLPYFDVILMSSGKLAAGADAGAADAPSADVKLSFYVDGTADYAPELVALDTTNPPTFPYTVGGVTYQTEPDYNKALLTKFFRDEYATSANNAAKYNVKGSDLEIDVMVDEQETSDGVAEFWSMTKAIAYMAYDSHIVKLICEVPVLDGLAIQGSTDNHRSVILDVNSFDIQIANNTEQSVAGLNIGSDSELRIMDGSKTAGAELAIGNNATMVIKKGGTLIIDESCTGEVEYDAASITDPTQQQTGQQVNGEITVQDGGKLINYGVLNIEGTEAKPLPQDPEQQQQETVIRDIRPAIMLVEAGGELENYGAISIKGFLYILGTLTNHGKYTDLIDAYDPDKGIVPYHKGIQITWKDDVRNPEVVPGMLNIGIDANKNIVTDATLVNEGDVVIAPGSLEVYGNLKNTGKIYLADVTEAVVPIQPSAEQPLVVEIRVDVDPMRPGLIRVYEGATLDVAEDSVLGATVQVVSNGRLGDLTETGPAKGVSDELKPDAYVVSAVMGDTELVKDTDYILKDGDVQFTDSFLAGFAGTEKVKINIGYRYYEYEVTGTKKGEWIQDKTGWKYLYINGEYAKPGWREIDGKWYYFDKTGYRESDAYRQGYYLDKNGVWDGKKKALGWMGSDLGWKYETVSKIYVNNRWMMIDGKWYYFKSSGYAAQNEFVRGWWIGKNCVQSDPVKCSWHKTAKGWWYGAKSWYAKGRTYVIDGVEYAFDKVGYNIEK